MSRAAGLLVARAWMNVCAIASFFIVGRFLSPAEFGIYALASSAILLPMGLLGAGFAEHVISRDPDRRDCATAFWATAALGFCFALLAACGSGLMFGVFHNVAYANILIWLAPLPALWGMSVILEAMLIRDDRTGLMTSVTVAGETLGLIALIAAAFSGFGVMSLVASRLVNNTIMLVGYRFFVQTPALRDANRETASRVGRFSLGVIGARAMNWVDAYGVELVLGALLPASSVGHYRMAGRLNAALGSVLVFAPWQAQLAYLSDRNRYGRMGAGVARAIMLHASLIAPLFAGLAVLSGDVIGLFLGPAWRPTASILSIMALASIVQVVWGVLTAAFVAAGQSRRMFGFQLASVVVATLGLTLGATANVAWAALAKFTLTGVLTLMGLFLLAALSPMQRTKLFSFLGRLTLAVAALALAMIAALHFVPADGSVVIALSRVALGGVIGLAAYGTILFLLAPEMLRMARLVIRKRFKRAVPATPAASGAVTP